MRLLLRSAPKGAAILAAIVLAAMLVRPGALHAATCAEVRTQLAQLNAQLTLDQTLLHQWCRNTLSDQCQQQGPGMSFVIK